MTPNKEDYLKVIYQEGAKGAVVSNKVIAERLGVTPASVTEMLSKLNRQGLINYTAYRGSTLTAKGVESCLGVVRSHRLWEVFLTRKLGYTWSEAHEEAHLLEHATPMRMVDRLDEFLEYPEHCPHGALVPRSVSDHEPELLRKLSELSEGEDALIYKVTEEKELLDYLEGIGVQIDEPVKVVKVGKYEGPITCKLKEETIQVSYKAASKIYVSELPEPEEEEVEPVKDDE